MKCHDIQQKLSAYAEGIVSHTEKILIEEHLKSCSKCNESFADLRKTIDYVKGLENVEPPAWLTQKVMTKIKTEVQPKKGIIQKLFYPLHIKLPLEAVVTVLIAVITIYIFKTMPPEIKLAQAPSEHETITARSPSKVDEEAISKEKFASPLTRKDRKRLLPLSRPLEKTIPSPPTLEKTIPSSPPLEKGPMARSQRLIEGKGGFEAKQSVPAKNPMITDKLEEAPPAPAPVQRQNDVRTSAGAVAKEEAKSEVLSRAAKAKVSDKKMEVINVTVLVKDIKTARAEIETAITQLEGRIIKTESLENKEIVTAESASQKLKEFIDNLKRIGEIKEKELTFETREGDMQIRVEILKIATQLQ